MTRNIEKYKNDIEGLLERGNYLLVALQYDCYPDRIEKAYGEDFKKIKKNLPSFKRKYQSWYSESKALVRQLLPDRLADFAKHYEKPKPRKDISFENYRIEDALQGLRVTRNHGSEVVVDNDAAIPHLEQQIAIVESIMARFESSLFDIRHSTISAGRYIRFRSSRVP
ncbi:hypothetical protein [Pseudoalteromonas maricaloris]|uniref:HEPN AbiU2-like domain-containing protein n=1 Tax=Pseudoalteromonas maricaloris TaxID=184924 RepID=A0ABZ0MF02_9GAMM|nr:hypothetical protein [Pseudoalteromonas maricaloris]WOX30431.1 hypothetical protein R5H13_09290 [Pseudoalteromonas maricaloris]